MIRTKKKFAKFRLDNEEHIKRYQDLLDDPMIEITEREIEKEKLNEYNDRGQLTRSIERLYYLIHWSEKLV